MLISNLSAALSNKDPGSLVETTKSMSEDALNKVTGWTLPPISPTPYFPHPLTFNERLVIDKDSTSDFSLDYLISILEFYFRTIYIRFICKTKKKKTINKTLYIRRTEYCKKKGKGFCKVAGY